MRKESFENKWDEYGRPRKLKNYVTGVKLPPVGVAEEKKEETISDQFNKIFSQEVVKLCNHGTYEEMKKNLWEWIQNYAGTEGK